MDEVEQENKATDELIASVAAVVNDYGDEISDQPLDHRDAALKVINLVLAYPEQMGRTMSAPVPIDTIKTHAIEVIRLLGSSDDDDAKENYLNGLLQNIWADGYIQAQSEEIARNASRLTP